MAQRAPDSPALPAGSGIPSLRSRPSQYRGMVAWLRKAVRHLSVKSGAPSKGREDAANIDGRLHASFSTERKQCSTLSSDIRQGLDIDWIQGDVLRARVERKFQRYQLYRTDSSGSPLLEAEWEQESSMVGRHGGHCACSRDDLPWYHYKG